MSVRYLHAPWRELIAGIESDQAWDALITDPPYSPRTHSGHDRGVSDVEDGTERSLLTYQPWTGTDVHEFVASFSPRVRGWMAALTDSELIADWRDAYRLAGRLDFHPVPCCISGMTVRVRGDGPSSEAVYLMLARPRTARFATWGTTRGYYEVPRERQWSVGGKPLALMKRIVSDYSRPGDLVVDPCCGGGTTGAACVLLDRDCVLSDADAAQVEVTRKRLAGGKRALRSADMPEDGLFDLGTKEGE